MNYPQKIFNFALATVFPVKCIGCGVFSKQNRHDYLCKSCIQSIPIKKNFECIGCSKKSSLGRTCLECRDDFAIDQLLIVSDYKNHLVEKSIKTLKYRLIPEIADCLNPIFKKYLAWLVKDKKIDILTDNPLLIPVPLHYRRLNLRGFNQAEIIAKKISEILLCEFKPEILSKKSASPPQADIEDRKQRLENIKNIFKINLPSEIKNRNIILIDDICTTGATLNETTRILKDNGAKKIIGFVVARG